MGGHLMERPKEFEDVFRGADLTKDEIRTLTWITGWERRTVENLKSAIQKVKETALSTLQAENAQLRAELEQVKQERDAAVQCIRGIAKSGRVWMCPYCVHAKDTTGGIAECELDVGVCMMPYSKFKWCSPQKED